MEGDKMMKKGHYSFVVNDSKLVLTYDNRKYILCFQYADGTIRMLGYHKFKLIAILKRKYIIWKVKRKLKFLMKLHIIQEIEERAFDEDTCD